MRRGHGFHMRRSPNSSGAAPIVRTDNFTRGDTVNAIGVPSDGGSAWIQQSGVWGINTNRGYESGGAVANGTCVLDALTANARTQVTLAVRGGGCGIVARATNNTNNFILAISPGTITLYRQVAGAFTGIGTFVGANANGDVYRVDCDAANLFSVYQNGVLRLTATDAFNAAATRHGLRCDADNVTRYTNFSITGL